MVHFPKLNGSLLEGKFGCKREYCKFRKTKKSGRKNKTRKTLWPKTGNKMEKIAETEKKEGKREIKRQFAPFLRHNEYKIVFTITTPRRLNVFPIENYIRRIR